MKLRNKKSGDIGFLLASKYLGRYEIVNDDYKPLATYDSISKVIEEWEDYKPEEPLIKDEKVRNIVKEWAVCSRVSLVRHYFSDGLSSFIFIDEEGNDFCLDFNLSIDTLECDKIYTITELCGEHEQ